MGNSEGRKILSGPSWIGLIGTFAAIITIFIFVTGYTNLPEILRGWLNPSGLYDDFDNSSFDGKYNPNLWTEEGSELGDFTQLDGMMLLQGKSVDKDGNFALHVAAPATYSTDSFRFMEARMKLDSLEAGKGSFLKIQAVTFVKDALWWIECKLSNSQVTYPELACNIEDGQFQSDGSPIYSYETTSIPLAYDKWYKIRFSFEPDTGKVRFYLDNRPIGETAFRNLQMLKDQKAAFGLQVGAWVGIGDRFSGFVDDVKIK